MACCPWFGSVITTSRIGHVVFRCITSNIDSAPSNNKLGFNTNSKPITLQWYSEQFSKTHWDDDQNIWTRDPVCILYPGYRAKRSNLRWHCGVKNIILDIFAHIGSALMYIWWIRLNCCTLWQMLNENVWLLTNSFRLSFFNSAPRSCSHLTCAPLEYYWTTLVTFCT